MATRARHFEAALAGFRDNSGDTLSGGKLQFYVPGTATAKNAFTDRDKTQAVTEVTLDSNGRAEVYGDGWYDIKLLDSADAVLATFEYVYLQRPSYTTATKTVDFTASQDIDSYLVDTTAGNVTVTMPAAADMTYPITIAKKTDDTNTVTIAPAGAETIDGAASHVLTVQSESVSVASDGANLYALGKLANSAITISTSATTAVSGKTRYATNAEMDNGSEASAAATPSSIFDVYGRLFRTMHDGLSLSLGADATHDIDIAVGSCLDSGYTEFMQLESVLTKQIDAAFAEGSDAGGFPSGLTLETAVVPRANSTTYSLGDKIDTGNGSYWWECTTAGTSASSQPAGYSNGDTTVTDGTAVFDAVTKDYYRVFLLKDVSSGAIDAGFDTSATAANLLSDATSFTKYRQIGWVLSDGAGGIVPFIYQGDNVYVWDAPVENINHTVTAPVSRKAVVLTAPPETVANFAVSGRLTDEGTGLYQYGLITDSRQSDTSPGIKAWNFVVNGDSHVYYEQGVQMFWVRTDANSQIQVRFSEGEEYGVSCIGYKYLWD